MTELQTRRVLVTGASRGIGAATAYRLAQQGYSVTVHFHQNITAANSVCEKIRQLGSNADLLQFNLSDREQTRAVLENEIEANGAYYGVVCNAGIAADGAFPALTSDQWDSVVHTNLDGFYNVLQPLVMPMIRLRQGGRIITLSSVSGLVGNRGQVNYSAAKAGIIGATKALALELAKRKITVNCVAPGIIQTDMTVDVPEDAAKKLIPLGRYGTTEEVSGAIAYLMSDDAAYITRQVLSINGGMC